MAVCPWYWCWRPIAILGGVVVVAMGRGGELTLLTGRTRRRYGREVTTTAELARFRPPAAFLGYSAQATDEALQRIARAMAERDAELAGCAARSPWPAASRPGAPAGWMPTSARAGSSWRAPRVTGLRWTGRPGSRAEPGPDGRLRCPWALGTADYLAYHDEEWGRPVRDDRGLFERLCLEAFQSGLSWLTILRKRENFRAAFARLRHGGGGRVRPR